MYDEKSIDQKGRNNSQVRNITSAKYRKRNDKKQNERNSKISLKNIESV